MRGWFFNGPATCKFAGNGVFLQSFTRGISSVGRAIGSQSIGQGFESPILHKTGIQSFALGPCFVIRNVLTVPPSWTEGAFGAENVLPVPPGGTEGTLKDVVGSFDLFPYEGNQRAGEQPVQTRQPDIHK